MSKRINIILAVLCIVTLGIYTYGTKEKTPPKKDSKPPLAFFISGENWTLNRNGQVTKVENRHPRQLLTGDEVFFKKDGEIKSGRNTKIYIQKSTRLKTSEASNKQNHKNLGIEVLSGGIDARIRPGSNRGGTVIKNFETPGMKISLDKGAFGLHCTKSSTVVLLREGTLSLSAKSSAKTLSLKSGEGAIHHQRLGLIKSRTDDFKSSIEPIAWFDLGFARFEPMRWSSKNGRWHLKSSTSATSPTLISGEGQSFLRFDGVDDKLTLSSAVWSGQHTVFIVARHHNISDNIKRIVDGYNAYSLPAQYNHGKALTANGGTVQSDLTEWNLTYFISEEEKELGGLALGNTNGVSGPVDVKAILVFKGRLSPEQIGAWLIRIKAKHLDANIL